MKKDLIISGFRCVASGVMQQYGNAVKDCFEFVINLAIDSRSSNVQKIQYSLPTQRTRVCQGFKNKQAENVARISYQNHQFKNVPFKKNQTVAIIPPRKSKYEQLEAEGFI